jgi:peptide/nickel transport system substrate-binding protein
MLKIASFVMILSILLGACATQEVVKTVEFEKEVVQTVEVEKEVVKTVEVEKEVVKTVEVLPTPEPVARNGAWVDQIVFTSIDEAPNAIAQLQADALDLYAYFVEDPDAFEAVKEDPGLTYSVAYGSWDSLLFNPSGPEFQDGRLNPFAVQKVREAVNWLIDREYLVQEAVGGLGAPKFVPLISAFPDYALYADLIRPLEAKYAYNFDKAVEVITAEMEAMGAEMVDGQWTYNGEPVTIIGLIRSEDERTEIGNYFCNQLEELGFACDRQIRTRTELAPIWQQSDPTEGQWHFYTGGNYYPILVRNQANAFADLYTNLTAWTTTEQAFDPTPEFLDVARRLLNNDYQSMEERRDLFAQALPMSLENSQYVQVITVYSFYPWKSDLLVASDLSSGVGGSQLWAYTIRWEGQEGGTVRSAQSGILTGPWNPVAGMLWIQELQLVRASSDEAVLSDPYTGLAWPQRLDRAEIQVLEGTPINASTDWVSLKFVDEIPVPDDAWVGWNASEERFITVGEKHPEGLTSRSKVTVYYPSEMWDIQWHDGSTLSVGDFVNFMIWWMAKGDPDSPVYDEALLPEWEAWIDHFKGVRILSTDPLIIETYEDLVDLDAENDIAYYYTNRWWPITNTGQMAWHSYALGMLAEANQELAFTADKSSELGVEWTNFIAGPSLEILAKYLDQAIEEDFIPWANTLGDYITPEEAQARYENLKAWYQEKGNFWVGTGPYYLDQVNSVEGSVVMKRYENFPDAANKWDRFGEPMIAVVDVTGPGQVEAGQEATFDAYVSFKDEPYPQAYIDRVSYLLYDASGELVASGVAEAVAEGQYQVTLSGDETGLLSTGAAKIEFVVASNVVAIPTFSAFEFVATAP